MKLMMHKLTIDLRQPVMLYLLIAACVNPFTKEPTGISEISEQSTSTMTDNPAPDFSKKIVFDFEAYSPGSLPPFWSQYFTGEGNTRWEVRSDGDHFVLAQLQNANPSKHFNIAVLDTLTTKNLSLSVKIKAISGNKDQGGGLVWRFLDKDNYYIVRANPLEDNVVLYKVENGVRMDLPMVDKGKSYGVKVPALGSGWNVLKLIAQDDLFSVSLNDREIFKVRDTTFSQDGKVGCWTKSDAATMFDDLTIEY